MASSPGAYVEGPRHAVVTEDDVGPIIAIVSLFLMVVMILAVILRLLVRFTTTNVPGYDDAVITVALFIAIGQVIATYLTVDRGLGTRLSLLAPPQLVEVEKGIYTIDILFILAVALSKASTLLLLRRLTVSRGYKIAGRAIAAIIAAWTFAALFGAAFKCNLPGPWAVQSGSCFDVTAFWTAIGTVDILLDVALVVMPVTIIWALQMPLGRRLTVLAGFCFRLILPVAQVIRLVYLHRYGAGIDSLLSSMGYTLATIFETTLAVVVACIPAFRPFLDRARSGLFAISFRERGGTYQMSSMKNSNAADRSRQSNGQASRAKSDTPAFQPNGGYHVQISATSSNNSRAVTRKRSDPDQIAQKTVEWEVRYSNPEKPGIIPSPSSESSSHGGKQASTSSGRNKAADAQP